MYKEIKYYLDKIWSGMNDPELKRKEQEREAVAVRKGKVYMKRWEEKDGEATNVTRDEVAAALAKQEKETQDDSGFTAGIISGRVGRTRGRCWRSLTASGRAASCRTIGSETRPRRSRRIRPTRPARTT